MSQSELFQVESEWAVHKKIYPSWSNSRAAMFRECPRKFFFNYVANQSPFEDPRLPLVYRLKDLDFAKLSIGSLLHTLFEKIIRALPVYEPAPEEMLDPAKWMDELREMWKKVVIDSRTVAQGSQKGKMLAEHYYSGIPIDTESIRKVAEESVKNFLSLEVVRTSGLDWDLIIALEKLEKVFYQPFFHPPTEKGFVIWTKLDYAKRLSREPGSPIEVWDWKTGKPRLEDINQVAAYALYALQKGWVKTPNQVKTVLYYTTENETIEKIFTEPELKLAERRCMEDYWAMHEAVVKPVVYIEDFPKTNEQWRCRYCPFYELCYESREISK